MRFIQKIVWHRIPDYPSQLWPTIRYRTKLNFLGSFSLPRALPAYTYAFDYSMQYKLYQFIPSLIWNTVCFKCGVD